MVEDILLWREAITTLPDHHFFEIIRMYLGEIKTPYNKQKLIEELSAFLRKDENKKNIIKLLSNVEIEILTAIKLIPNATVEKLGKFFNRYLEFAELYELLMNLEERLLVFRYVDKQIGRTVFNINPLLRDYLDGLLIKDNLLLPANIEPSFDLGTEKKDKITLKPEFLAAVITFTAENPDLCKADGTFKKRIEVALPSIFPQIKDISTIQLLISAFINLNLFRNTDNGIVILYSRLKLFAQLPETVQYCYLTVASCGHFPRDLLQKNTQLLLDTLMSIPRNGFTKETILRSMFLYNEKLSNGFNSSFSRGRFASIIKQGQSQNGETKSIISFDDLLQNALRFQLLQQSTKDINGNEVFLPHCVFLDLQNERLNEIALEDSSKRLVSIDSGFTVTILPGLSLERLLPFTLSMEVIRFDTILQMEVTRQSAMRSFDAGETPTSLLSDIQRCATHELPQNLSFSFNDWFSGYNSAALFKGYVLRIVPEKAFLVEKNPEISPYIIMNLAQGVFLLDFASDEEAVSVIKNSGLDFIGSIKDIHRDLDVLPFAPVYINKPSFSENLAKNNDSNVLQPYTKEETESFIEKLEDELETKDLSFETKEELRSRIQRKIIVNKVQLRADSVRPEKIEAVGMDFLGKIHVIEHAIASCSLVELAYDGIMYLGLPQHIEKQTGDSIVKMEIQPEKIDKIFSIGRAQRVKRIRGPIFKEPKYD